MARTNLPWPYFRGMWAGLTFGMVGGIWLGVWKENWFTNGFAGSPIAFIITGSMAFVALLPDAIAQISLGIGRYRSAAK